MKPFLPMELPLKHIVEQTGFLSELIEAHKYLSAYEGAVKYSKVNSQALLKPLMRQEATLSSKIEGSRVTLDQALEFNENDVVKNNDTQEILNYHKALLEGEQLLNTLPLCSRLLKNLHGILLGNNVRGGNSAPGEFRRIQNFIGPPGSTIETASFVPPEPQLVDHYMSNLDNYINNYSDFDELVKIAIIHAQFETIHPFLDGNGRIGRILIPLYLYYKKVTQRPYFFISETLERDRYRYYNYLNQVRFENMWNEWIKFFLESIANQSKTNIERLDRINELYERHLEVITNVIKSNNSVPVFRMLYQLPIFTVQNISNMTGINYQICNRIIKKFEEQKIIYSDGSKRNTKYYYYDLLDLLR